MFAPPDLISPRQEMLAYETLWSMRTQSIKTLADLFRRRPGYPSQLLEWSAQAGDLNSSLGDRASTVAAYIKNLSGFSVCVHGTELYPEQLQQARHPIELFYYKGDIGLAHALSVSVVGARTCSPAGAKRAGRLARELVAEGYAIVSGLAEGIDTAAMGEAIRADGRVIGVIGTPINECYPKQNRELQEIVGRDHLLISHVPFFRYFEEPFESRRRHFPERNATMAALSHATVIVEASETSGTHSQARACLANRKPLFILNSCFEDKNIVWPAKYLGQGAIRIRETREILDHLTRMPHEPAAVDAH
jgi:DNA processing protein